MNANQLLTTGHLVEFKKELIEELRQLFSKKTSANQSEFLKSKDVKNMLQCKDSTLQHYRNIGKIPFSKIGGTYYYKREDIQDLMAA